MEKDFDKWNEIKKLVHKDGIEKFYHAREVWWCSLGTNVGFEQDGSDDDGQRPVLILKGFSKHVCIVVPLTTSTKKNPYHVSAGIVDSRNAFAITSQVRLVDTKRLVNKVGVVETELFDKIRKAIKDML